MEVTQFSCRVVYADSEGSVHMCLPIYIDTQGACHAAHDERFLNTSDAEDVLLSSICEGASCTDAVAAARKLMMERVIDQAMHVEDFSQDAEDADRRKRIRAVMMRLQSAPIDEKDALRRAILADREMRKQAVVVKRPVVPRLCFLPAPPLPLLLTNHSIY